MGRYRTILEIECEAETTTEAIDVAGEYLRGSLASGVKLRCVTKPVINHYKLVVFAFTVMALAGLAVAAKAITLGPAAASGMSEYSSACSVPLRTGAQMAEQLQFRSKWTERQTSKALEHTRG